MTPDTPRPDEAERQAADELSRLGQELGLDAQCTCSPLPHGTGPEADCDVHGQPSVAYQQGYSDGHRHWSQIGNLDIAEVRAERDRLSVALRGMARRSVTARRRAASASRHAQSRFTAYKQLLNKLGSAVGVHVGSPSQNRYPEYVERICAAALTHRAELATLRAGRASGADASDSGEVDETYRELRSAVDGELKLAGIYLNRDAEDIITEALIEHAEAAQKVSCPDCAQWSWHGPDAERKVIEHWFRVHQPVDPDHARLRDELNEALGSNHAGRRDDIELVQAVRTDRELVQQAIQGGFLSFDEYQPTSPSVSPVPEQGREGGGTTGFEPATSDHGDNGSGRNPSVPPTGSAKLSYVPAAESTAYTACWGPDVDQPEAGES